MITLLEARGITKRFGGLTALSDVSLTIRKGEVYGLIGPNGAGKTTLMRAIMGILPAKAGSLRFQGQAFERVATHLRARAGIGYMPEDRRLVPTLTVEENVLVPAWAGDRADTQERLKRVYQMIPEVETFQARKGLQLSGGQQKLVALARALMSGTKLLLLDEPFEGVAPVLARRLSEVIAGLRSEGMAIILTESDLSHSKDMLDSVYTIDRGVVTAG